MLFSSEIGTAMDSSLASIFCRNCHMVESQPFMPKTKGIFFIKNLLSHKIFLEKGRKRKVGFSTMERKLETETRILMRRNKYFVTYASILLFSWQRKRKLIMFELRLFSTCLVFLDISHFKIIFCFDTFFLFFLNL